MAGTELQILRHGKAQDHGHPGGDGARALVERGREQAIGAAEVLQRSGRLPELVLTSPVLRAVETAEAFCKAAGIDQPIEQRWLACGMTPETAVEELRGYSKFRRVMLVGHEPDLSSLVEYLLGCTTSGIEVKKGALVGLAMMPSIRHATLRYLIPPKMG